MNETQFMFASTEFTPFPRRIWRDENRKDGLIFHQAISNWEVLSRGGNKFTPYRNLKYYAVLHAASMGMCLVSNKDTGFIREDTLGKCKKV